MEVGESPPLFQGVEGRRSGQQLKREERGSGGGKALVGSRVRKYRKRKGLSQDQLGAMIGFSQSKISKIENGDWDSLSDLRLITKALGVKLKELIDDDGDDSDEKEDAAVDERR